MLSSTKKFSNTGWLVCGRAVALVSGFFVLVLLARYLEPNEFGQFNYSLSFVALFGVLSSLGLHDVIVRNLVNNPSETNLILGSAFLLRMIGSVSAFTLSLVFIVLMRPGDSMVFTMVGILSFAFFFKSFVEIVKTYFESKVKSKYVVIIESSIYIIMSSVKIILILNNISLLVFVWIICLESLVLGIGLFYLYCKCTQTPLVQWSTNRRYLKKMFYSALPLALSALALVIHTRIDQVMLGQMLDDQSVGVYAAAVRLSEAWLFVPLAVIASFFPDIMKAKQQSHSMYQAKLQHLYNLVVLIALLCILPIVLLSNWGVHILYGASYVQAADLLRVLAWAGIFSALITVSGRWFVNEGLEYLTLQRNLIGAAVNICLNYILIPRYGHMGAAWSTIVVVVVVGLLADAFSKKTRPMFWQKMRSIFLIDAYLFFLKRILSK